MSEVSASLGEAADDESGKASRRAVCQALGPALEELADRLRVAGSLFGPDRVSGSSPGLNGDDRVVGMGYIAATASSLITGASLLIQGGNLYAASALNRQLVEVEYIAWAFAEDRAEASVWLRSSAEERRVRWQPRHLRERSQGRFRGKDYRDHCEFGGHPTPEGARTLLGVNPDARSAIGGDGPTMRELLLFEVAQHGTSAWQYLLTGVVAVCLEEDWEPKQLVPDDLARAVGDAQGRWLQAEGLGEVWAATEMSQ